MPRYGLGGVQSRQTGAPQQALGSAAALAPCRPSGGAGEWLPPPQGENRTAGDRSPGLRPQWVPTAFT